MFQPRPMFNGEVIHFHLLSQLTFLTFEVYPLERCVVTSDSEFPTIEVKVKMFDCFSSSFRVAQ